MIMPTRRARRGEGVVAAFILVAAIAGVHAAVEADESRGAAIHKLRTVYIDSTRCDSVSFHLETETAADDSMSAISRLVNHLLPSVDAGSFDVHVAPSPPESGGGSDGEPRAVALHVTVECDSPQIGGDLYGLLHLNMQDIPVFLSSTGTGVSGLFGPSCRVEGNQAAAAHQHQLDIVSFSARIFGPGATQQTMSNMQQPYLQALFLLVSGLNAASPPQVDVQAGDLQGEPVMDTTVRFSDDPSSARLLSSVVELWGAGMRARAISQGPARALSSPSVLTTAVSGAGSQPHDLAAVRFTVLLRGSHLSLDTEEDEMVLKNTLLHFYSSALSAVGIGNPLSIEILWTERQAASERQSALAAGIVIQFLDKPNAVTTLATHLSRDSTMIDAHAPKELGRLGYRDVSGHHSMSVLRFTAHLPGLDMAVLTVKDLESVQLKYISALRSLAGVLDTHDIDPHAKVLHIGDTCTRFPAADCQPSLMLDTVLTMVDDAAGAQSLVQAISRADWRGFVASLTTNQPLLAVFQASHFTHISGQGHQESQRVSVCFSAVLLDHRSPSAGIELKYSEWGRDFIAKYKGALQSAAVDIGVGSLDDVQVLHIQGSAHPVVYTYVTVPSSIAASKLSATLHKSSTGPLAKSLLPQIGKVQFSDVSGTHLAHQVRFTSVLADMASSEGAEAFQQEYLHELLAVVDNGGAQVPPEARVIHAHREETGWALDTTLLFLDDKRSAEDFIEAASVQIPGAMAESVGRMAVKDISGHLESQHVSFTAELVDFTQSAMSNGDLTKLQLFYELLLHGSLRLLRPSHALEDLPVQVRLLSTEGAPRLATTVVCIEDADLAEKLLHTLKDGGQNKQLLSPHFGGALRPHSVLNNPVAAAARREMLEVTEVQGGASGGSSSVAHAGFYGFYGTAQHAHHTFTSELSISPVLPTSSTTESDVSATDGPSGSTSTATYYGYAAGQEAVANAEGQAAAGMGSQAANLAANPAQSPSLPGQGLKAPQPLNTTVEFMTVMLEKHISDLTGTIDKMEEFLEDYHVAMSSALEGLGLVPEASVTLYVTDAGGQRRLLQIAPSADTSLPSIEVLGVHGRYDGVGAETRVVFRGEGNSQHGIKLTETLTMEPEAISPFFTELGDVKFVFGTGASQPEEVEEALELKETVEAALKPAPAPLQQSLADTPCRHIDKYGECCMTPGKLDASFQCCYVGVDECGVCGGDSSSCAVTGVVRVMVPYSPVLLDKRSAEFMQLIGDFKSGISLLLHQVYSINATSSIQVEPWMVNFKDAGIAKYTGTVDVQMPFTLYPNPELPVVPGLAPMRAVLSEAASQKAAHNDIVFLAVLDVYRQGVCANAICELAETSNPLQSLSVTGSCVSDCQQALPCPVGLSSDPVGLDQVECSSKGYCHSSSGACECHPGYAGDNCGQCADGYADVGEECAAAVIVDTAGGGVMAATPAITSADGTSSSDPAGGSPLGTTFIVVLACIFGALVAVGLCFAFVVAARRKQPGGDDEHHKLPLHTLRGPPLSTTSTMYTPRVSGDDCPTTPLPRSHSTAVYGTEEAPVNVEAWRLPAPTVGSQTQQPEGRATAAEPPAGRSTDEHVRGASVHMDSSEIFTVMRCSSDEFHQQQGQHCASAVEAAGLQADDIPRPSVLLLPVDQPSDSTYPLELEYPDISRFGQLELMEPADDSLRYFDIPTRAARVLEPAEEEDDGRELLGHLGVSAAPWDGPHGDVTPDVPRRMLMEGADAQASSAARELGELAMEGRTPPMELAPRPTL